MSRADVLIQKTATDTNRLIDLLYQVHDTIDRLAVRNDGSPGVMAGYVWPAGYTEADYTSMMAVLKALPDSVVTTSAKEAVEKFVSTFV